MGYGLWRYLALLLYVSAISSLSHVSVGSHPPLDSLCRREGEGERRASEDYVLGDVCGGLKASTSRPGRPSSECWGLASTCKCSYGGGAYAVPPLYLHSLVRVSLESAPPLFSLLFLPYMSYSGGGVVESLVSRERGSAAR
jgi:hypothetical protein